MRISDWSSDVCSSDLLAEIARDFAGGDRGAAFAGDQRRQAHAQLAGRRSVAKQHSPGLVEHVDEARRDIASARIDLLLSRSVDHAGAHDSSVRDRTIGGAPGIARAVEHARAGSGRAEVRSFFAEPTFTVSYVVHDPATKRAEIIDSV